ncbi:hypothetical protein FUAX_32630 [Fulvitalea axinellae]|uniref:DUF4274 domain-containing protein n=2 Tax=Fulvitalea axinellae TaxID=1182444 RepID=A0AAU9CNX7_9BACT|nr:hypothetical protein FUAX_32630 [Fulvitalea axinellae]
MEFPIAIANNQYCDKGTALTLFWLAGGLSVFTGENKRNEHNGEWFDFCETLIDRLTKNVYPEGPVDFDPPINKVTAYKYRKAGIPATLYEKVEGKKS